MDDVINMRRRRVNWNWFARSIELMHGPFNKLIFRSLCTKCVSCCCGSNVHERMSSLRDKIVNLVLSVCAIGVSTLRTTHTRHEPMGRPFVHKITQIEEKTQKMTKKQKWPRASYCLVTIITIKLSWHFSVRLAFSWPSISFTHRRTNRVSNRFVCSCCFPFIPWRRKKNTFKYMIKYRFEQQRCRLYLFFGWHHPNNGSDNDHCFLLFVLRVFSLHYTVDS